MTMEFEGPGETDFTLVRYVDGRVAAVIANANWSAKQDEPYDVSFVMNGAVYSGKAHGTHDTFRSGFIVLVSEDSAADFAKDFARGSSLHIFLGEQRIDQLSLDGTAAASAAVNRCLAKARAAIAADEAEKARWAHLPKDPFAPPPPPPGGPAPLDQSTWTSHILENYPARALREGHEGSVKVRAMVGPTGAVTGCEVVTSSGFLELDTAACDGIKRYGRFSPGHDAAGAPISGEFITTIVYSLN